MITYGLGRHLMSFGLGEPYLAESPVQPAISELAVSPIDDLMFDIVVGTTAAKTKSVDYD